MFEINIDSNSPRISLARAAQLTGYHQDYLGQLCRLGKLPATKVGRNWFTSAEALNTLGTPTDTQDMYGNDYNEAEYSPSSANSLEESIEGFIEEQATGLNENISAPIIAQNVTVENIEELPIAIHPVTTVVRSNNNVQNILTGMRIESLQNEVGELRRLLFKLMDEVKSHTNILQARDAVSRVQDSLKHSYVSNFDFNLPSTAQAPRSAFRSIAPSEGVEIMTQPILRIEQNLVRKYALADWLAVAVALLVISFISVGIATGNFFGTQPHQQSYYYHPQKNLDPTVAGAETLPTDSAGELIPDVVQ